MPFYSAFVLSNGRYLADIAINYDVSPAKTNDISG